MVSHNHEATNFVTLLMKMQNAAMKFIAIRFSAKPACAVARIHPFFDRSEDGPSVFGPRFFVAWWRILAFPLTTH